MVLLMSGIIRTGPTGSRKTVNCSSYSTKFSLIIVMLTHRTVLIGSNGLKTRGTPFKLTKSLPENVIKSKYVHVCVCIHVYKHPQQKHRIRVKEI